MKELKSVMNMLKFISSISFMYVGILMCTACSDETPTDDNIDPPIENSISFDWDTKQWDGLPDDGRYTIEDGAKTTPVTVAEGNGSNYTTASTKYYNTRIPAAEVANDGSLILLWQGRFDGTDRGNDHLLISRSTDFGQTWTEQAIFTENTVDLGDNSLVIDRKTGRLFAMAYSGGLAEKQLIYYSDDNGVTWIKLDHEPITNLSGEPLRMRGTTGIQIAKGDNNALIMPAIAGSNKLAYMTCLAGSKSWRFLAEHDVKAWNEPTIVEMADNNSDVSILNVTRRADTHNNKMFKRQAISKLNAASLITAWTPISDTEDFSFNATTCNQHLKRYTGINDGKASRILYASTTQGVGYSPSRYGGTVAYSDDEGLTWNSKELIATDTHFGYCIQVVMPDGTIGLFYETHNDSGKEVRYGAIKFIRYTMDWLMK